MAKKRLPLVVECGDWHCGSDLGLLAPGAINLADRPIPLNPVQEWMWEQWEYCWDRIKEVADGSPIKLVTKGDLIEGNHHGGRQISDTDTGTHKAIAKLLFRSIPVKLEGVYVVRGTECHVSNAEEELAEYFGAEHPGHPLFKVQKTFDHLLLNYNDWLMAFRHHSSVSVRKYLQASKLSIQFGDLITRWHSAGWPLPRTLSMAHCHEANYHTDGTTYQCVSPSWQFNTRHVEKVVPGAVLAVGFIIHDARGLKPGSMPRCELINRPVPPPKVHVA